MLEEMCSVSTLVKIDKCTFTEIRMNWNHLVILNKLIPIPFISCFKRNLTLFTERKYDNIFNDQLRLNEIVAFNFHKVMNNKKND